VVGIDDFEDPAWRDLEFAEKDAADMAEALSDAGDDGFDRVIKLTGPDLTEKEHILAAMRGLHDENISTEDVVLIYFSTHGTLARDDELRLRQYLVARDTDYDNVSDTALDMAQMMDYFSRLKSRRKVLIVASCHSGMGKSELPDDIRFELEHVKSSFFVKPLEMASEASVIIGVCGWGETAREDPELGNDIYTHFFIEGMSHYDRNEDGAVSISEAHDYAQRKTYYFTHGEQRPFARSDILGTDPIILKGQVTSSGKPVLFSYSEEYGGARLWLNGTEKGTLPDGYITERGWNDFSVRAPGGSEIEKGKLYVRSGERVNVDRIMREREIPSLGVSAAYRSYGAPVSEDVSPALGMYGVAYQLRAFPFQDTGVRLEADYGQAGWQEDLPGNVELDINADVLDINAGLVYEGRVGTTRLFGGPMVGGLYMWKRLEAMGEVERKQTATFYPGAVGGLSVSLNESTLLEVTNKAGYVSFNVDDETEGAWSNEFSITIYFDSNLAFK